MRGSGGTKMLQVKRGGYGSSFEEAPRAWHYFGQSIGDRLRQRMATQLAETYTYLE
jgi:hypothetical protein